ncbi:flagellar assembly protein FliH [Desulfovibrionales bacterium]
MFLSSQTDTAGQCTSRIVRAMGSGGANQTSLGGLGGRGQRVAWSVAMEVEYMDRVKARAAAKAKEILDEGRAEVDVLRKNARQEGFTQGLEEAQEQMKAARQAIVDSMAQALTSVQAGMAAIWQEHRQALTDLVRLAVERVLGRELAIDRYKILEYYLAQAVDLLDRRTGLCVRVHPDDEATMQELLERARECYQGLDRWHIRTDVAMQPGGLAIESDYRIVDNTIKGRLAPIREILDQLDLAGEDIPG